MSDQKQMSNTRHSRRHFIYGALITCVGVATVMTMPKGIAVAAPEVTATSKESSDSGAKGYRVTQHIINYYRSASL